MEDYPFIYYQKEKESKIATRLFIIFVYILLIFYAIVFSTNLIFRTTYRYITIEGCSMQPTLNPDPINTGNGEYQDGVYIRLTQNVDYGDIIIVDRSQEEGEEGYTVIKRAMAFEGDKISIAKLPVGENGKFEYRFIRIKADDNISTILYQGQDDQYVIYEDYIIGYDLWSDVFSYTKNGIGYESTFYVNYILNENTTTYNIIIDEEIYPVEFFEVGSNKKNNEPEQIFYMGDNRINSNDSRATGTADIDKVVGKVIKIVHNGFSIRNSMFSWAEKVWDYLVIIWNEIIDCFSTI